MSDHVLPLNNVPRYSKKMCQSRRPNTAGYGYHRRRLRINQELRRGSNNRASLYTKSGEHNLVSSSVHRNLLMVILGSFVPLLLLQGDIYFKFIDYNIWRKIIVLLAWPTAKRRNVRKALTHKRSYFFLTQLLQRLIYALYAWLQMIDVCDSMLDLIYIN